jgi:hypothetical protein
MVALLSSGTGDVGWQSHAVDGENNVGAYHGADGAARALMGTLIEQHGTVAAYVVRFVHVQYALGTGMDTQLAALASIAVDYDGTSSCHRMTSCQATGAYPDRVAR